MNNLVLVAAFVVIGSVLGLIGAPLLVQQSTPPPPPPPTPTPTPTSPTPTATPCPACDEANLVWPSIRTINPTRGNAGDHVDVKGNGGYYYLNGAYDESSRSFPLYFDGVAAGSIRCYVNACSGTFNVPMGTPPGQYEVKSEGGSPIIFEVTLPTPTKTITPTPEITSKPTVSLIPEGFGQELDLNEILLLEKQGVPIEHLGKLMEFIKCNGSDVIGYVQADSMLKKLRDGDSVETGCTSAPVSPKTTAATPTPSPRFIEDPTPTPLPIPNRVDTSAEGFRDFYLMLQPSVAVPGQEVLLTGRGASSHGSISKITVGSIAVGALVNGNPVSALEIDNAGNFVASFLIPDAYATYEPGRFEINVRDNKAKIGEVTLEIPARTVEMSTNSSGRGSKVTIAGSGFPSNDHIQIHYLTGLASKQRVATTLSNSYGSWQSGFTVPSNPAIPSENIVEISGSKGSTQTLRHSIPGANIWTTPDPAVSGSSITVNGSSFPSYSIGKITIGHGKLEITPVPRPNTDANGNFLAKVSLPYLPAGSHPIWLEVNGLTAVATVILK